MKMQIIKVALKHLNTLPSKAEEEIGELFESNGFEGLEVKDNGLVLEETSVELAEKLCEMGYLDKEDVEAIEKELSDGTPFIELTLHF